LIFREGRGGSRAFCVGVTPSGGERLVAALDFERGIVWMK